MVCDFRLAKVVNLTPGILLRLSGVEEGLFFMQGVVLDALLVLLLRAWRESAVQAA